MKFRGAMPAAGKSFFVFASRALQSGVIKSVNHLVNEGERRSSEQGLFSVLIIRLITTQ
ncbi:hypothetical protein AHF37_05816 [Paragonimus kellicotti]|nr:hypothetical protein AHF37_05816 [Paragonimus kellicotti]